MNTSDQHPDLPAYPPKLVSKPSPPRKRSGILNPTLVRVTAFVIISLALFGSAALCVMAVWDYAPRDVAWRSLATLGIIAAAMIVFTLINEKFGSVKVDAELDS
jgi:hypothetical protein